MSKGTTEVRIYFADYFNNWLEKESNKMGVSKQAIIKQVLHDRIEAEKEHDAMKREQIKFT